MRVGSKWLIVGVGLCTILSTGAIAPAAERVGMHIGYTVEGEAGGKHGTLTEAWILPPGSLTEHDKGIKSTESSVTRGTGKGQPAR